MTRVVATVPHFGEDGATLTRALQSLPPGIRSFTYEAPLERFAGYGYRTESELRDVGRAHAQLLGADFWLQLDSDERLVNGTTLETILPDWPHRAYPLPRLEEGGELALCPYKLVRLPCRLVAGCDHFILGDDLFTVWRLSLGYGADELERRALLQGGLPYLVHEPSRVVRTRPRLGTTENELEPRPADALQWPAPTLLQEARTL